MIEEKRFAVTLAAAVPLRIGGPQDPLSGADNPITRVADRLAVPGSTLKGSLRAQIERYLIDTWSDTQGTWRDDSLKPCIPSARPSDDENLLIRSHKYRPEPCAYAERGRSDTICPACYFLGAMGLTGFLRVPFLFAAGSPAQLYSASLDRATGTVRRGANFPYELVPQGTTFTGALTVILQDTVLGWELGKPRPLAGGAKDAWLPEKGRPADELIREFIIERLQSIKLLGGYKSKGFGEVSIKVEPQKTGE